LEEAGAVARITEGRFDLHADCDCDSIADEIETAINDGTHDFASETLESLYDYWTENDHFTDAQQGAIQNILNRGR